MDKILNVQATLLRNATFEDHNMTKMLFKQQPATFELNVKHDYNIIEGKEDLYNVNVNLTIKSFEAIENEGKTEKGEPVYTAKIQYSGIFYVKGFTPEELEVILEVNCPSIVFPYARAELNRMLSETQMQKPQLQPIQFDAIYMNKRHLAEKKKEEELKNNTSTET